MSRTTSTYFTLAYGMDERKLYVNDSVTGETFAEIDLSEAVLLSTQNDWDEPDYDVLTEYVVEMVNDSLEAGGFTSDSTAQLVGAVRTFVSPGGPYEPRQVRFAASRLPSADSRQVLTGDEPTLLSVSIDDNERISGSRKDMWATILLQAGPDGINWSVRMTWDEARELAKAITDVVDIAENG